MRTGPMEGGVAHLVGPKRTHNVADLVTSHSLGGARKILRIDHEEGAKAKGKSFEVVEPGHHGNEKVVQQDHFRLTNHADSRAGLTVTELGCP